MCVKSRFQLILLIVFLCTELASARGECQPVAVATWHFGKIAVTAAADILRNGNAVDAVEAGVNAVELDTQDQYFVGYGGLPNADGVMELDAAIMDGNSACSPCHSRPASCTRPNLWRSIPHAYRFRCTIHTTIISLSPPHALARTAVRQSLAPPPSLARRSGLPVRRGARIAGLPPACVRRAVKPSPHSIGE